VSQFWKRLLFVFVRDPVRHIQRRKLPRRPFAIAFIYSLFSPWRRISVSFIGSSLVSCSTLKINASDWLLDQYVTAGIYQLDLLRENRSSEHFQPSARLFVYFVRRYLSNEPNSLTLHITVEEEEEESKVVFLGGHFLFTCSDTDVCIVSVQCSWMHSVTDRQTVGRTTLSVFGSVTLVFLPLKYEIDDSVTVAYFLIGSHTGHINIRLYQSSYSSYPPKLYISR